MLIIAGNKIDREDREIPTSVGEDFAARHNMYFLETSAKEAENVETLFMQIAEDLMKVCGDLYIQVHNYVNSKEIFKLLVLHCFVLGFI